MPKIKSTGKEEIETRAPHPGVYVRSAVTGT